MSCGPSMQQLVRDEVRKHIPKGDYAQMLFRMDYSIHRQHDLAGDGASPAVASIERAAASVRTQHPGFEPEYDHDYFGRIR